MNEIYKALAEKHNLHQDVIEKICRSQFDFLSKTFTDNKFESLRLPNLGIFKVKKGRLKKLNERYGIEFTEEQIKNSHDR